MGLFAGALDALGGGGWGPVGTTSLLSSGRLEPRKVVGSVDTAEFVVSVGGSLGFQVGLGREGIDWAFAGALLVGGVVAAPVAALVVRHLVPRVLGVAAGGLIVLTNLTTLGESLGSAGDHHRRLPGVGRLHALGALDRLGREAGAGARRARWTRQDRRAAAGTSGPVRGKSRGPVQSRPPSGPRQRRVGHWPATGEN